MLSTPSSSALDHNTLEPPQRRLTERRAQLGASATTPAPDDRRHGARRPATESVPVVPFRSPHRPTPRPARSRPNSGRPRPALRPPHRGNQRTRRTQRRARAPQNHASEGQAVRSAEARAVELTHLAEFTKSELERTKAAPRRRRRFRRLRFHRLLEQRKPRAAGRTRFRPPVRQRSRRHPQPGHRRENPPEVGRQGRDRVRP